MGEWVVPKIWHLGPDCPSTLTTQWIHAVTLSLQVLRVLESAVGVSHNYFIYLETGKDFEYFKYLEGGMAQFSLAINQRTTLTPITQCPGSKCYLGTFLGGFFPVVGIEDFMVHLRACRPDHSLHLVACHFGGFLRSHEGLGYLNTAILKGMG